MRIDGIDHVQLAMPPGGEGEATAFYEDVLGMTEVPKPPALAARGGCWFESANAKVHLGVDPDFRAAKRAHPALVVSDLAAVAAVLSGALAPIRHDKPVDGFDRLFTEDPFGNRIELMQPIATADEASLDLALSLERQVWEALLNGDGAADQRLLSNDFVGVYPTGFATRSEHVEQLADGPSMAAYELSLARLQVLSVDAMLLAYRADYEPLRNGVAGEPEAMLVSSIWTRRHGEWKNTFSQDTPVAASS